MIKPTIGRRVWYWPSPEDIINGMVQLDENQALDAGVIFVHGDDDVNLMVTDHRGVLWPRQHVYLSQPLAPVDGEAGHAEWMPYQVGRTPSDSAVTNA